MVQRLTEQYALGTAVQITFNAADWWNGVVVHHQPPGIWVQTADGRYWFVTNTRRVRPMRDDT